MPEVVDLFVLLLKLLDECLVVGFANMEHLISHEKVFRVEQRL